MERGIEKCAELIMNKGKRETTEGIEVSDEENIRNARKETELQILKKLRSRCYRAKQIKKEARNTSEEQGNY